MNSKSSIFASPGCNNTRQIYYQRMNECIKDGPTPKKPVNHVTALSNGEMLHSGLNTDEVHLESFNDGIMYEERIFKPYNKSVSGVENFEASKFKVGVKDVQGDQEEVILQEQFRILIYKNKELLKMNCEQKENIERLMKENESFKESNKLIASINENNMKHISQTIDSLQQRISELYTRVENHHVDSIEKESGIRQIIDILQDAPKHLNGFIHQYSPSKVIGESYSDICRPMATTYPVSKSSSKLTNLSFNIKVMCRPKPDFYNCFTFHSDDTIFLPPFKNFKTGLGYRLNRVFKTDATNFEVFSEINPVISSCFLGGNACLITYGQSGSGKTHTMIGTESEPGIMFLTMKELMKISKAGTPSMHRFHLSILEIYNEKIYDLMSALGGRSSSNLNSRVFVQDNGYLIQLKHVSETEIKEDGEFEQQLNESLKRRSTSLTSKNQNSSRSHFIVMLRITELTSGEKIVINCGSLIMCDLAGSENYDGLSYKEQMESKYINKSITMLNRVFDAMYRNSPIIPFRDSKLTHLLKPSLMGNASCVFIATVCSRHENINDTYRTLNVAKKAEMINFGNA